MTACRRGFWTLMTCRCRHVLSWSEGRASRTGLTGPSLTASLHSRCVFFITNSSVSACEKPNEFKLTATIDFLVWYNVRCELQVLANIAERMKDMHAAGYAHRDLKPANVILLPRENRWTVIDFGCAARIGALAPVAITLTYSPPEVLIVLEGQGTSVEVTAAVDVWALGVMAFELLTGAPAFRVVTDGVEKVCPHGSSSVTVGQARVHS